MTEPADTDSPDTESADGHPDDAGAVDTQAAAALEQCRNTGVAPAGYAAIGDAQTSGPKL